jgi:hypothetical protein
MRKKAGTMQFKEAEENDNPYDSDEQDYLEAEEREAQYQKDMESEEEQKSYDSELEADFFGKKDPEANGREEKEAIARGLARTAAREEAKA